MIFLIKNRLITEGPSDEQIFWLENQARPLQAKTPPKFFTNEMIDLMLERTNTKISKMLDNAPKELLSRDNFIKETTAMEIRAFIGLLI